jgi:hypothetical protein
MSKTYDVIIKLKAIVIQRDYNLGVIEGTMTPEQYLGGVGRDRVDRAVFDNVLRNSVNILNVPGFETEDKEVNGNIVTLLYTVSYPRDNVRSLYKFFKNKKFNLRADSRIDAHPRSGKEYYIDFVTVSMKYTEEFIPMKDNIAKKVQSKLMSKIMFLAKKSEGPESVGGVLDLLQQFFVTENGRVSELNSARQKVQEFARWYGLVKEWKKTKVIKFNVNETPKKLILLLSALLDVKTYLRKVNRSAPAGGVPKLTDVDMKLDRALGYLDQCNGFLSQKIVALMVELCDGAECDSKQSTRILEMFCTGDLNSGSLSGDDFDPEEKKKLLSV